MNAEAIRQADPLPALDALLDSDVVKLLLEAQFEGSNMSIIDFRVDHVRYRRRRSYVASYIIRALERGSATSQEFVWYIRCMTADAFARIQKRVSARTWSKPRIGSAVTVLPQHQAILFAYPNDYHLEGLRVAADRESLRQALSDQLPVGSNFLLGGVQTTLVRYRPEDRAVLLGSIGDASCSGVEYCETRAYFKVYSDDGAIRTNKMMERLLRFLSPQSELVIPRTMGYLSKYRMSILGAVPGVPLSSLAGTSQELDSVARVGESLARLHGYCDAELPRLTLNEYHTQTKRTLNRLHRFFPPLGDRVLEIRRKLAAGAPEDDDNMLGFVHGDFLPGNILVSPSNIALLDLDLAYTGCVAADIGKFLAHLGEDRVRGGRGNDGPLREVFLDSYSKASRRSFGPQVLRWWTATAVIRRISRLFRQLRLNTQEAAEKSLRAVEALLD